MSAYILLARTHGVYLGERQENTVRVPGDKRKKKRKWVLVTSQFLPQLLVSTITSHFESNQIPVTEAFTYFLPFFLFLP